MREPVRVAGSHKLVYEKEEEAEYKRAQKNKHGYRYMGEQISTKYQWHNDEDREHFLDLFEQRGMQFRLANAPVGLTPQQPKKKKTSWDSTAKKEAMLSILNSMDPQRRPSNFVPDSPDPKSSSPANSDTSQKSIFGFREKYGGKKEAKEDTRILKKWMEDNNLRLISSSESEGGSSKRKDKGKEKDKANLPSKPSTPVPESDTEYHPGDFLQREADHKKRVEQAKKERAQQARLEEHMLTRQDQPAQQLPDIQGNLRGRSAGTSATSGGTGKQKAARSTTNAPPPAAAGEGKGKGKATDSTLSAPQNRAAGRTHARQSTSPSSDGSPASTHESPRSLTMRTKPSNPDNHRGSAPKPPVKKSKVSKASEAAAELQALQLAPQTPPRAPPRRTTAALRPVVSSASASGTAGTRVTRSSTSRSKPKDDHIEPAAKRKPT
jgi:hypothetical protein